MQDVYVIWWMFHDNSSAGIARVHSDRQRAEEEVDLLSAMDHARKYMIDEQPLYDALRVNQ